MNYLKQHLFAMIAVAALASSVSYAQVTSETLDSEVDAQIDQMYPQGSGNTATHGQVINQNVVVSKAVQKQPVTVVEASPLSNSNADSIRRNRQDEELRTETRIVEKLELSRMEDEKRRAQVLFGDKFDTLNNRAEAAPAAQPAQPVVAPSSNVPPTTIVVEQKETLTRDAVHEEVRAALEEDKAAQEAADTDLFERKYFVGQAGVPMYSDAQSIKGNYSMGVGLGTSNDYLEVEGGFIFSSYRLENSLYYTQFNGIGIADFNLNQYQGYVSAKFLVLAGTIKPTLGALASYSYRTYAADQATTYGGSGTSFGHSNAVDVGLSGGLDITLNRRFTIGADMKYMFNMTANIDGDTVNGAKSPEKLSYYMLGVNAKLGF